MPLQKENSNYLIRDISELIVTNDYLLVTGLKETEVDGVYKGKSGETKPSQGLVVNVGESVTDIKQGDTVLFNEYLVTKFKLYDTTYHVVKREDVIGYKKSV